MNRDLANSLLGEIILHNLNTMFDIIQKCRAKGWSYRVSSSMFPLVTHPEGIHVFDLFNVKEIHNKLNEIADYLKENPIHLSCHPDHFNILESLKESTVESTICELELAGWLFDCLGLPRDYSCPINIHVICQDDSPLNIAARFKENFKLLSESVQKRLVLENNDKGIWNAGTLYKYFHDFCPLTYDNLHDEVNPDSCLASDAFFHYLETWTNKGFIPHFHYSEGGKDGNKRAHLDMPTKLPEIYGYGGEIIFDVELKSKNAAIEQLELLESFGELYD
jgi:UV DNA damage endonuclease